MLWPSGITAREVTSEGAPSQELQLRNFKNPGKEHKLSSEMGGAIRPVCWGWAGGGGVAGGGPPLGLDRLFYKKLRITARRAGSGTSCSLIQLRLVCQSQTCRAGSQDRNFLEALGWWSRAVCRPAEHPSSSCSLQGGQSVERMGSRRGL